MGKPTPTHSSLGNREKAKGAILLSPDGQRWGQFDDFSCMDVYRAVHANEELIDALCVAYQFFSHEANMPDAKGLTVAPDSVERIVLRKMWQAITKATGV